MDVLSQVAQNNAARSEAAKYNADREAVAHWNAVQSAKQAEAGRVLNQAPSTPVEGLAAKLGYSDGSLEDAYKLQLVKQARKENDYRAAMEMIAKNQAYQADKKDAEMFGDKVGPDGKYKLISDAQVLSANAEPAWDMQEGPTGDDPVSLGLRKLQKYLINKPREAANVYTDNVDPGLAAKWMADRGAFK